MEDSRNRNSSGEKLFMRRAVLVEELVSSDISNDSLYKEYERLLERDIIKYFVEPDTLIEVPCPGCGAEQSADDYDKMNMNFKVCAGCGSHYVSPRPSPSSLEIFYRKSDACTFWRKESLTLPEEKLQKLHKPRVQWILELIDTFMKDLKYFMDFETKYPFFIEKISKIKLFNRIILYDPKVYEQSGLLTNDVLAGFKLKDYSGKIGVITAFETLERMFNPDKLFTIARDCCEPGGLLLVTTASCSGFEYQVLGKHAPKINPINRMNLLTLETLQKRFELFGFEVVELSTPGRLDVETAKRTVIDNKNVDIHPFWKYIFEYRDANTSYNLQKFLQQNRLSSHVRIAAKKI